MAKTPIPKIEPYTPLQQQILAALQDDEIARPHLTIGYKLGLLAVAAANLLLPLLYFGLIFLVAHAIYWNARYNLPGRGPMGFVIYFGAYILGFITLVFLIKPLFARDPKASSPLNLKRSSEPFLYEYVEAICDAVNAPAPNSIRLICEPNAAASFSRGLMGLVTGQMTLTIGLPLAAGMSVRQLTGVLAHEFGHFSQGGGMRLCYIVRVINFWLLKIVFLRDSWDEALERYSQNGDWRFRFILYAARGSIWTSRQLLFGLLWMGNAISCFLMRQMEFDADRYEARMVGHRTFAATCSRLSELSIAHQMAMSDLRQFHSEGRLADDLPTLIVSNVPHISPKFRKEYRKQQLARQTGLFDTHPADRERIENARQEDPTGLFQLKGEQKDPPATVLFTKFERLCRAMTFDFYEDLLGDHFKKKLLHPASQLIAQRDAELEAGKALDRYFQIHVPVDRPLTLYDDTDKPPAKPREAAHDLKAARDEMLRELKDYQDLPQRYEEAENTLYTTAEALSVMDCGLRIRGRDFGLASSSRKAAEAKHKRAKAAVQYLAAKMLVFETAASMRISTALRILQVPKVADAIPDGRALQEEVRTMIRDARLISGIIGGLPILRILYRRIAVLFARLGKQPNQKLVQTIIAQIEGMSNRINSISDELKDQAYPFDHADDTMTLRDFVIPYLPEEMDVGGLVHATQLLFERLYTLQVRLFARLTQAAEKVETVLGLPPLPVPTNPAEAKDPAAVGTDPD